MKLFAIKLALRDLFWLLLLTCVMLAWFVDRTTQEFRQVFLRFNSQAAVYHDREREICLTEHHLPGFMGLPVWQAWSRSSTTADWEPLFTVASGFQSDEPGKPIVDEASGALLLADEQGTYAFDVAAQAFRVNRYPDRVYRGGFRCYAPPK